MRVQRCQFFFFLSTIVVMMWSYLIKDKTNPCFHERLLNILSLGTVVCKIQCTDTNMSKGFYLPQFECVVP